MPQPRRAASQPGVSAVPSSAHAEPGWTREELSGNHAAREDQGRGKPSCTPFYTHRSVTARNGQNSSSPSTSVDIPARRQCRRLPLQGLDARHHRAPLRASRLTLRSLLLRPVRPARRGRPSRRCCAPAPGSPVNRTPHETLDHPTVAFCRTAKGLESGVMRAGPVRRCRPMLAAPVRSSAPPRLMLHSLLRSVRPTRRGRPSRRCCAPAPGSSVNRTPHETRDHPTVAPCRTAENLRAARCGRARIAAWPARRSCPMRDVPAMVGAAADLLQILTVVAALR